MSIGDKQLDELLDRLAPVILPPAEYPPADVVRDTPRDQIVERIENNASKINLELSEEHWEVIDFLFGFYVYCCETKDPGYLGHQKYWEYIDCISEQDCEQKLDSGGDTHCEYGQLSAKQAIKAYPVYRVLLKAFKQKGGKKHLYKLFPYGPIFTIHLLAQLPRLVNDVDPHYGTAY